MLSEAKHPATSVACAISDETFGPRSSWLLRFAQNDIRRSTRIRASTPVHYAHRACSLVCFACADSGAEGQPGGRQHADHSEQNARAPQPNAKTNRLESSMRRGARPCWSHKPACCRRAWHARSARSAELWIGNSQSLLCVVNQFRSQLVQ